METAHPAPPVKAGKVIIRHTRCHAKESTHSYLPRQPPQVSNLFAASDAHPGRVLDDLCQRPLSGGGHMIMGCITSKATPRSQSVRSHINAKRPAKSVQQKPDLSQRRSDRVHGSEPGEGRWLIRAAQHHSVPGVWGVQLQLSEGGDKKI